MNVILENHSLSWRPLITIPTEHVKILTEWRTKQSSLNLIKGLDFKVDTPEYQERLDLTIELLDLHDNCVQCLYELVEHTGWYSPDNVYSILFQLEIGHPFTETPDDRPVIPLEDYDQTLVFNAGSIKELTELLNNIPPSWTIRNSVNIVVRDGEFSILTD